MEIPMPPPCSRSPEERLKASRSARAANPKWEYIETVIGVETSLLLFEEDVGHPDNRPLLRLCNMDDELTVLGEIWFAPADIRAIIDFLQWQLTHNYMVGKRRWRENDRHPTLYVGEAQAD